MSGKLSQFLNVLLYPKKAAAETITGGWSFLNSIPDTAAANFDVTDTSGFATVANFKVNGTTYVQVASIFGLTGFLGPTNGPFFFGNSNALYYFLINPAAGNLTINVNNQAYTLGQTDLGLINKTITTTGAFTDGTTPIVSSHNHTGTGNQGAVIPHVSTLPTRALNTTYTNSAAQCLIVSGNILIRETGGGTGSGYVDLKTDTNSPPTTIHERVGVQVGPMAANTQIHFPFFMIVQPGHRYRIDSTTASATLTINRWREAPL